MAGDNSPGSVGLGGASEPRRSDPRQRPGAGEPVPDEFQSEAVAVKGSPFLLRHYEASRLATRDNAPQVVDSAIPRNRVQGVDLGSLRRPHFMVGLLHLHFRLLVWDSASGTWTIAWVAGDLKCLQTRNGWLFLLILSSRSSLWPMVISVTSRYASLRMRSDQMRAILLLAWLWLVQGSTLREGCHYISSRFTRTVSTGKSDVCSDLFRVTSGSFVTIESLGPGSELSEPPTSGPGSPTRLHVRECIAVRHDRDAY